MSEIPAIPRSFLLLSLAAALLLPVPPLPAQEAESQDPQVEADPARQEVPEDLVPRLREGQEVYLSTSRGVDRIDIALPAPKGEPPSLALRENLVQVLRGDLHFSGLFRIVDPTLYDLVEQEKREGEPQRVTARRWQSIGAAYLLRSQLQADEDQVVVEAWLVDLVSGDEVLGKRYTGTRDLVREMAHTLADDIVVYFTGSPSVFNTRIIYASRRGENQEIFRADYDGANEQRLTSTASLNLSPSVSPDGTLAAFTSYMTGRPRLHLAELATGKTRLLYDCPGLCQAAAWSPSGRRLAFSMSEDGNSEIYVLEREGGSPVRLTDHPAIDVSPTWSPTGDEIAFVSDRAGRPQVYVMDRYGLNVRRLTYTFEQATEPAWSPKGDRIAYSGRHEGFLRICLLELASKEESCFPPVGGWEESPAWSPDGSHLAFLVGQGGTTTLYLRRADGVGDPQPVFLRGSPRTPEWTR